MTAFTFLAVAGHVSPLLILSVLLAIGAGVALSMSTTTTTNPADFADRSQVYFNRILEDNLKYTLRLGQYAKVKGYSVVGVGGSNNVAAIRFFRARKANLSGILAASTPFTLNIVPANSATALVEGTVPSTFVEVTKGYVDIIMGQRGELEKFTDIASALDLFNLAETDSAVLGQDAALDYDTVCRNGLINGLFNSNNTYQDTTDGGFFERFAGVKNSGNSQTDYGFLAAAEQSNASMTRTRNIGNITQLKVSKIPRIGNRYVCICPHQGIHDLRQSAEFVTTWEFQDKQGLFQWGDLMIDGCVYIEANNPWIEGATYGTEQTNTAAIPQNGLIYSAIYLGQDAFGAPNLNDKTAGSGGASPEVVVIPPKKEKADPLGQFGYIGWKAFYGSAPFIMGSRTNEINDRPRYTVFRFKSTFQ